MPTPFPVRSPEDVERLLASMSLEEKAGQLKQLPDLDTISDEAVE